MLEIEIEFYVKMFPNVAIPLIERKGDGKREGLGKCYEMK